MAYTSSLLSSHPPLSLPILIPFDFLQLHTQSIVFRLTLTLHFFYIHINFPSSFTRLNFIPEIHARKFLDDNSCHFQSSINLTGFFRLISFLPSKLVSFLNYGKISIFEQYSFIIFYNTDRGILC